MEVLCIGHAASALTAPNLVAIKAMGRSDVYMKLEFVRRVLMLLILAITVFAFDFVIAMAYSFALSAWIDAIVCAIPSGLLLGYGVREQFKAVAKTILASVLMGMAVWAVGLLAMPLFLKLVIQIVTGVIVYIILCRLMKIESFLYILDHMKQMKKG